MYIVFGDYKDYDEYVIGIYETLEEARAEADEDVSYLYCCGVERVKLGPRYDNKNVKQWPTVHETSVRMMSEE
jgi:hypothetical protein